MTGEIHNAGDETQAYGNATPQGEGGLTVSNEAMLAYGYDLGGTGEWKVREAFEDEDGWLILDWFGPEDEENGHFAEAAMEQMLTMVGFTETWDTEAYWDRAHEAPKRLSVEIVPHGSNDEPMYVLATQVIPAHQDGLKDVAGLLAVEPWWDERLRTVLSGLGLTPTQREARWLRVQRRHDS
ncbi:hypothetical protein [Nonomuraea sp. NPDC049028]|uniref:hypothetical protein n=1 Tax=Nonomuraea sp. NPDC049028 TaxID=3364348 RepID=UPI003715A5BB